MSETSEQPTEYDPAGDPLAPVPLPARTAPAAVLDGAGVVVNLERVDPDALQTHPDRTVHVLDEDGPWPAIGDTWDGDTFTRPEPAPAPDAPAEDPAAPPASGGEGETVAELREQLDAQGRQLAAFVALVVDHTPENVAAAQAAGAITAAQAQALQPSTKPAAG